MATYWVRGSFELESMMCLTICNDLMVAVRCLALSPGHGKDNGSGLAVLWICSHRLIYRVHNDVILFTKDEGYSYIINGHVMNAMT